MFDTIVSIEELEKHLGDRGWVILDCRHSLQDFEAGRKLYEQSHIPGAFFASVESDLAGEKTGKNGRHPLPEPDRFAAFLRELGVHDSTQIVTYDAGGDMFAARAWLVTRYIGHDAVAVLDGGFAAWTAAGKPVTGETSQRPHPGSKKSRVRPEIVVPLERVVQSLQTREFSTLDARTEERFSGRVEPIDPVGGHIPGARNRDFHKNFDRNGRFKSPEQLRAEFAELQIEPKDLVHQCGSGVSAAVNMLAMEIAGLHGSRIYPGGWSEWVSDRSRPIQTS